MRFLGFLLVIHPYCHVNWFEFCTIPSGCFLIRCPGYWSMIDYEENKECLHMSWSYFGFNITNTQKEAEQSSLYIIMILIKIYWSLSIQNTIHFTWMQLFHPNNHPSPSVATSWSRCEKFRASLAWSSWPFPSSLKLPPFTVEQWPDSPLGYLVYTLPKTNSSHG